MPSTRTVVPIGPVVYFYGDPYDFNSGPPPQWGDASDDTWAYLPNIGGIEPSALLPATSMSGVTAAYCRVRADGGVGEGFWEVHLHTELDIEGGPLAPFTVLAGIGEFTLETSWQVTESVEFGALHPDLVASLEAGSAYITAPYLGHDYTIYEMELVLIGGTTRQRIVQRDDRARIVRTSSRQNSNRLTGYR